MAKTRAQRYDVGPHIHPETQIIFFHKELLRNRFYLVLTDKDNNTVAKHPIPGPEAEAIIVEVNRLLSPWIRLSIGWGRVDPIPLLLDESVSKISDILQAR